MSDQRPPSPPSPAQRPNEFDSGAYRSPSPPPRSGPGKGRRNRAGPRRPSPRRGRPNARRGRSRSPRRRPRRGRSRSPRDRRSSSQGRRPASKSPPRWPQPHRRSPSPHEVWHRDLLGRDPSGFAPMAPWAGSGLGFQPSFSGGRGSPPLDGFMHPTAPSRGGPARWSGWTEGRLDGDAANRMGRNSPSFQDLPASVASPLTGSARGEFIKSRPVQIKEYISDTTGVLEFDPPDHEGGSIFFHASVVFLPNPRGNPYGPPVRFVDESQTSPLARILPVGSELVMNAEPVISRFFQYLAFTVWPRTTEPPLNMRPITSQFDILDEFHANVTPDSVVRLTINEFRFPELRESRARIWEIKDDAFGLIEVLGPDADRFFCVFHRQDVYLRDGKRAICHEFFQDKPLAAMVSVNQLVTLSARSIVLTKGCFLRPAILELQAVVVSLEPNAIPKTAPRPTRFKGGDGLLGVSNTDKSYAYFNEHLVKDLNIKLHEFMTSVRTMFPNIDPKCLEMGGPESSPAPESHTEFNGLTNTMGVVKEILSETSGLLELATAVGRALCLFTLDHMLPIPKAPLAGIVKPGLCVKLNAKLISKEKPIQYLGTQVWIEKDEPDRDVIMGKKEPEEELLQKYYEVNEMLELASQDSIQRPTTKYVGLFPPYYSLTEASVFRILDDNFGLLKVNYNLILFDVCDFWLDPDTTASRMSKNLRDVIAEGDLVMFHASLVDNSVKVQYLASSVWQRQNANFTTENRPRPIQREQIHEDKVKIYRTVVESIADILPNLHKADNPLLGLAGSGFILALSGTVTTLIVDQTGLSPGITGGVLKLEGSGCFAFFLSKFCSSKSCLQIGDALICAVLPLEETPVLAIHGLAVSLYHGARTNPPAVEAMEVMAEQTQSYLVEQLDLEQKKRLDECVFKSTNPILVLNPQMLVGMRDPLTELVVRAKFVSMLGNSAALLRSKINHSQYIYYELDRLNLTVSTLSEVSGFLESHGKEIELEVFASETDVPGPVKLVAHANGSRVKGNLPKGVRNIRKADFLPTTMLPVFYDIGKWVRFNESQDQLQEAFEDDGNLMDVNHCRGVFKYMINDNFGLIYGPNNASKKKYCLFDTYDLKIARGQSAADRDLVISRVLSEGDEIEYNACVIHGDNSVPYLATSVWKPGDIHPPPEPFPKAAIQSEKVTIYEQVVESCQSLIESKEKALEVRPDPDDPPPNASPSSYSSPSARLQYDLQDHMTKGRMELERCEMFAILGVGPNFEQRALVTNHRVWIKDKPKFGNWRALHMSYFKNVSVCARHVKGFRDFQFQVIFTHAGFYKRDPKSHEFLYSPKMREWMASVSDVKSLDKELDLYIAKHGK